MGELLVLFAHLLAVCVALGMIVLTDLRLLARVAGYRVVIPAPSSFERRVVSAALLCLYATGATLISLRLRTVPGYLANPKLQAKLLLVLLLTVNALVLHKRVFPVLEQARRVADWSSATRWKVSLSVGLSNSLWFYCAFLGIARPWNYTQPLAFVLLASLPVWLAFVAVVRFVLTYASRDEPQGERDWLDSIKSTIGAASGFGDSRFDAEPMKTLPPISADIADLPPAANETIGAPARRA